MQEGNSITYTGGTVSGSPTVVATLQGFDTQWRDLATVTPGSIALDDTHVGFKLRIKEVATNAFGTTTATSSVTTAISRSDLNWVANPDAETTPLGVGPNIGTEAITQDATHVDTGSKAIKVVTLGNTAFEGIFGPIWGSQGQAIYAPAGQARTYVVRAFIPSGVTLRLACNYFDSGYNLIQAASTPAVGTGAYAIYTLSVPAIGVDCAHQLELTTGSSGASLASQTFYVDKRILSDVVTTPVGITLVGSVITKAQSGSAAFSQAFTVPSGVVNGCMVIVQSYDDKTRPIDTSGTGSPNAPKWGASAATLLSKPNPASGPNTEWWIIKNPPAGTNNVTFSHTNSVAGVLAIYLLQGVDQTTPTSAIAAAVVNTVATHPTISVPSTATDFVIGTSVFGATNVTTLSQDSGPTQRYNIKQFTTFGIHSGGATYAGDGTSKTFGWFESNAGSGQPSVLTAVAFKAAGPPPPPVNTALPVITGTPAQDGMVSVSDGSWQAGVSAPTSFSYQFLNGPSSSGPWSPIDAASSASYFPTAQDVGKYIVADVTAYDAGGSTKVRSAPVGPVIVTYPIWDSPPNLYTVEGGSPRVGQTAYVDEGETENSPTSYVKQWQRDAGTPGSAFSDFGSPMDNYTFTAADEHYSFRVHETATNSTGSADAYSNVIGPVEPQTPLLDSGNGQDENPLASLWQQIQSGTLPMKRVGNHFASTGDSGPSAQASRPDVSLADMLVRFRVTALPVTAGRGVGAWFRCQNTGVAGAARGYAFDYILGSGFTLFCMTSDGSYAQIAAWNTSHVLALNEYLVAQISGSRIDAWYEDVAGVLHPMFINVVDTTIAGIGTGGMEANSNEIRIDNFDIQPVTTHPIYTVQRALYLPASYDGSDVRLVQKGYGNDTDVQADMTVRDDWQKVHLSFQPTISLDGEFDVVEVGLPPTTGEAIYVDGLQTELGPIATPFRLTTSDAGRIQAESDIVDETTFGAIFRVSYGFDYADQLDQDAGLFDWRDDEDNRLSLVLANGTKLWTFQRLAGGVGTQVVSDEQIFSEGDQATVAIQATATDIQISVDGADFVSVGNTTIPGLVATLFDIAGLDAENQGNLRVRYAAFMRGNLTNFDIAAIHNILVGGRQPLLGDFPTSANITAIMPMIDETFYKPL
jgi:hypothetical protein